MPQEDLAALQAIADSLESGDADLPTCAARIRSIVERNRPKPTGGPQGPPTGG